MINEQIDGQGLNKRERGCLVLFYLFVEIVIVVCYALCQTCSNSGTVLSVWARIPASFLIWAVVPLLTFGFTTLIIRYLNNLPFDRLTKAGLATHCVGLAITVYSMAGGTIPPPMDKTVFPGEGYMAVAGDSGCVIALKEDGHIVGWGKEIVHGNMPSGSDYIAIDVDMDICVALRTDGSIAAWGHPFKDTSPITEVPAGNEYIAISISGGNCLALKRDGSLISWGRVFKDGVPKQNGERYIAIDAMDDGCLALRENGALIHWRKNKDGKVVRSLLSQDIAKIATLAGTLIVTLKTDGSIKSWSVPGGIIKDRSVPPGKDFQDVAAGYYHGLALKNDGRVVGWSEHRTGAAYSLRGKNYRAIAAGGDCSFAIDSKGRIIGWGQTQGWGGWDWMQFPKTIPE